MRPSRQDRTGKNIRKNKDKGERRLGRKQSRRRHTRAGQKQAGKNLVGRNRVGRKPAKSRSTRGRPAGVAASPMIGFAHSLGEAIRSGRSVRWSWTVNRDLDMV